MHTIALATQKGGSGKSTLAIGLAVAAMDDGQRVGVIEADPQGTISNWGRRRTNPEPRIERAGSGTAIEQALLDLERDGITVAIIDTAATDNVLSTGGIGAADLCLIAARPSAADIEAALPTLSTVRRLEKKFAFILNQTPVRSPRTSNVATTLNASGVLALPYIVLRNDHQDALGAGLGVTEYDADGKAAEEIRGLWRWVWQSLTADSFDQERTAVEAAGPPDAGDAARQATN
jgi:chromosome partitioning protein